MISQLFDVARAAESPGRSEFRDRRRRMTRIASLMRRLEILVRRLWLSRRVTCRAGSAGSMVILMAIAACCFCRRRRKGDRSAVTLDAHFLRVNRVKELDRPRLRLMSGNRDRGGQAFRRGVLFLLVA